MAMAQEPNQSVLTDISEATETSEVTIPGGAKTHRNAMGKAADDFCRSKKTLTYYRNQMINIPFSSIFYVFFQERTMSTLFVSPRAGQRHPPGGPPSRASGRCAKSPCIGTSACDMLFSCAQRPPVLSIFQLFYVLDLAANSD